MSWLRRLFSRSRAPFIAPVSCSYLFVSGIAALAICPSCGKRGDEHHAWPAELPPPTDVVPSVDSLTKFILRTDKTS